MTRYSILKALHEDFANRDLRGVAGDWFEQDGHGPFVAIQTGVYRHQIIGVYSRLDGALNAGELAIIAEEDHYHDVDIVEAKLDRGGEFTIAVLRWEYDDGKQHGARTRAGQPGRVKVKAIAVD